MRTVSEIFEEQNPQDGFIPIWAKELAFKYAKECLEEAAKVATTKCYNEGHVPVHKVDKQSILNLIKELK